MIDRIPAKTKALSQSEELALYDHVGKASIQHLRDRTAGILIESDGGGVACGSAVAVQVEDRTFLLTAAHNFNGAEVKGTRVTVFSANRSSNEPLKIIASTSMQLVPMVQMTPHGSKWTSIQRDNRLLSPRTYVQ
jgi:hypothetical protein